MTESDTPKRAGEEPARGNAEARVPTVSSELLLQGGRELRIVHDGEVYRLLLTRNNRLILQK